MEKICECILYVIYLLHTFLKTLRRSSFGIKPSLMIPRAIINVVVIFVFVVLVGYSVAQSLKYESFIGFILALTSLGAAIYFIYLLTKARQETEAEETI